MNLNEYQIKIGSVVYPPTPVRCNGMIVGATSEPLMELEKAWGNVGSRAGLGENTNISNFYSVESARAGTNAVYRFSPFGLDMEAFQRVAIESGVNTADRSLPITLELTHGGAAAVASNLDVYVLADALFYINADGSMSVSV